MVSVYHLILLISILNAKFLLAEFSLEISEGPSNNEIEKVPGKDENDDSRFLFIEKFRYLLGLQSFNIWSRNRHTISTHGLLSPSSAPAPAPAPVPVHHTLVHSHHKPQSLKPSRNSTFLHLHGEKDGEEDRQRRIVIALAISSGVIALVMVILGIVLFCWKMKRSRKRSLVKISVYGNDVECKRSNKVSYDLGPEHFYINSLGPEKHTTMSSKQTEMICKFDEKTESRRESIASHTDNISCSLWVEEEEVHSVHEVSETDSGNYYPIVKKMGLSEQLSSEDESFHSVCDSYSSKSRLSDVSDEDLSNTTEVCSTPSRPTMSSPYHSVTPLRQSSWRNSPSRKQILKHKTTTVFPSRHIPSPPPPPPPLPQHIKFSQALSPTVSNDISARTELPRIQSKEASPRTPPPPCPPMPPPPPPLPSIKGPSNSAHPPPPPPGHFLTPLRDDGSPLPKLKPLHWDKVRATPDRSTVWDNLKSNSFEFDEEMIESLFGYSMKKNDETRSKTPSPTKHILEPKRLQNVIILSKALNVTPVQICDALIQGRGLCLQQLEALVKMVPTKEEESNLLNYQGDINELDSAEKFMKAMLTVPFAFARVEAMLFQATFEDEVIHLRESFAMLEDACKELRSSRLFLKLLEAVLKTGNRMNVGTIRGGARAFKLDALLKLADVKGTDGKTTLLHFVVQEMIRSEGIRESEIISSRSNLETQNKTLDEKEEVYKRLGHDLVSGLCTELCNVKKTATIDLDVIASSVSTLSDGMLKLQRLVQDDLSMEPSSGFVQSMRSFLDQAQRSIKELQKNEDRVLQHVKEITEYFHGHVSKDEVNPLRIFVIVRDFLGMLDQVCKEVKTVKITHTLSSIASFR
ncbi:hypothetical protein ACHQM5_015104 [Ranunculus cassubicifolius]